MAGRVSGLAVFYATAGGILLWSGFKGQTLAETIKAITSGNAAALSQKGTETVGSPTVSDSTGAAGGSDTAVTPSASSATAAASAPASDKAGTPAANKALGLLLAGTYGWAGSGQWPYLESGWQEESGWNQYAFNIPGDYDAAYGIPQANPGTKMASAGSDWKTDPATQIRWGLQYIKETYGSPAQVPGWTPNGPGAGYVGY